MSETEAYFQLALIAFALLSYPWIRSVVRPIVRWILSFLPSNQKLTINIKDSHGNIIKTITADPNDYQSLSKAMREASK